MISRRSFLTVLSCLPFVGKLIPREPEPKYFFAYESVPLAEYKSVFYPTPGFEPFPSIPFPARIDHLQTIDDKVIVTCSNAIYEFSEDGTYRKLYPEPLTFAEWDRRYQA